MTLTTREDSLNYEAIVTTIKQIYPIPDADNIVRVEVFGNSVIVSKDVKVGDIMIYFTSGTKLSEDLCFHNNLYSVSGGVNYNEDQTKDGYISYKQRRVKAIKLRGVISNGMLLPLDSLNYLGFNLKLKDGDSFTTINNVDICEKYKIKRKNANLGDNKKIKVFNRVTEKYFKFHENTSNLRYNSHRITPESIIGIHYKKHGCVSGSTIIDTLEYGEKTIKEIVDNKIKCHIKAFDIFSKEIVYANIDDFYFLPDNGEWYEIELENGTKIEITSNNPVWLPNLKCYREVKDLLIGDFLLVD